MKNETQQKWDDKFGELIKFHFKDHQSIAGTVLDNLQTRRVDCAFVGDFYDDLDDFTSIFPDVARKHQVRFGSVASPRRRPWRGKCS